MALIDRLDWNSEVFSKNFFLKNIKLRKKITLKLCYSFVYLNVIRSNGINRYQFGIQKYFKRIFLKNIKLRKGYVMY